MFRRPDNIIPRKNIAKKFERFISRFALRGPTFRFCPRPPMVLRQGAFQTVKSNGAFTGPKIFRIALRFYYIEQRCYKPN